jgi:hypothetical protein
MENCITIDGDVSDVYLKLRFFVDIDSPVVHTDVQIVNKNKLRFPPLAHYIVIYYKFFSHKFIIQHYFYG